MINVSCHVPYRPQHVSLRNHSVEWSWFWSLSSRFSFSPKIVWPCPVLNNSIQMEEVEGPGWFSPSMESAVLKKQWQTKIGNWGCNQNSFIQSISNNVIKEQKLPIFSEEMFLFNFWPESTKANKTSISLCYIIWLPDLFWTMYGYAHTWRWMSAQARLESWTPLCCSGSSIPFQSNTWCDLQHVGLIQRMHQIHCLDLARIISISR